MIRGGTLRTGGYLAGTLVSLGASVVLLRYLGIVDLGRYVTVMSVLAIASGLSDAGLTTIAQREYAVLGDRSARRRVLADTVGVRIVLTPICMLLATGFSVIAGYDQTMVVGTLVGGLGFVITNIGLALLIPPSVELRLGVLTTIEFARQVVTAIGLVVLALAGASLLPFFAVTIVAGIVTFALAFTLGGREARIRPRFATRESWELLREAAPVALALVVNVLYVRVLLVLMSLMSSDTETGAFATSFRVIEVFVMIPLLMIGSAFPLLAHAGREDLRRLAHALQRAAEVTLFVAGAVVVVLTVGAGPVVELIGGSGYDSAIPVLQIQAFALIGAFMTQVWVSGLIALRGQRALVITNTLALASVLVLGFVLIPPLAAQGAAIAAVIGELALALATLFMLIRAEPRLRPQLGFVLKLALAGVAATIIALVPGSAPIISTVLALAAYVGVALLTRAVPSELAAAFTQRLRS